MTKFLLTPLVDRLAGIQPAVMRETVAAKYVGLGIHEFRRRVRAGEIRARLHPRGKRRIYLRSDLDAYASSLEVVAPGGVIIPLRDLAEPRQQGV